MFISLITLLVIKLYAQIDILKDIWPYVYFDLSILIVCVCDVMNFEVNLILIIKPLFEHFLSRDHFRYLENKKAFKMKQKYFLRAFRCQKVAQTLD